MSSILKLKTTEGWEWPSFYTYKPASLAILEYTGSGSMQFYVGTLTLF
jgi:hypothetical protein